ncbi:alkylation response protein AidB-like acyl-CoA dehydrogenase [Parabacteroides sp. PF5-5]|uniref:acyl-CoA dehydrogenase family protein n=1 Tax=unclassified Parabacteroides TaxID=2649774 RepID=UPI002475A4DA|nr:MULTISPECIES: acyl-CoA dehydrogenase family protein [unclassified Parabacteroides]MDH6304187.1 alkylation response protein AidB-like acyl-CoA dehydrogenase [Parabacteroides sp. PH5-39]MDH6315097.1 alkylation response protein AidB-like acyl-CoA dehydrogenase [Parabacteroides sp. PF5-13]MDH6318758.1 alkylation response protein AidB-like acyl-CoA dehydrogenase [Parabacteroides sp. PH5-13]MDH6322487.1 alkylation response protein AidB-like acyl-CoA dehydrogenase [Parabacteroides sp. PH5-8]MDH632
MANYFLDTPGFKHHLHHPLMKRIVELKERNYADKDEFDYAPYDFEDAMDSYEKVLEIVGEICDEIIAPNAEGVDQEGPKVKDGRVSYASGTQQNLDTVRKAGLMGISMPRRYGGLNFPITPYIMAADMVSRADAGFENLWGLQDCAETLYEFGNEDQRKRYIPRVCGGETMSMDLTEPDAGSDLQSVMLKATYSEKDDCWYLNGVKRFITNGDSDIHLVLARSEEGTRDGRGLSMFIYDKRNGGVNVRRIENKMGIKGSPTCELVYKNAKAELCGERKLGLIKYVMALMNGARLGIMAQAVGLCEAAYREGYAYALERKQFGKAIIEFPAVYEMVALMRAKTDASRTMLYETSRFVDVYKALEDISRDRKLEPEERQEMKKYSKLADAFTPLGKGMTTEYANQNAYDAIQIHGGSGFMKDYACERLYRDARITNIYEGTTQLQVVAAIRHVTTGTYLTQIREYEALDYKPELEPLRQKLIEMTSRYDEIVGLVMDPKDSEYLDFHARRLVETAGHCIMGYLLLQDANKDEVNFRRSAEVYITYGQAEVNKHYSYITTFDPKDIGYFKHS